MKAIIQFVLLVVARTLASASALRAESATVRKQKVLFFSKASGFEHEAIKLVMKDGRPGYAYAVLRDIGDKNHIEFTFSKDGSLFPRNIWPSSTHFSFARQATSH